MAYFNNGYTLLELIVVLFIFALLSGLAVPRLLNMYDSVQMAHETEEVISRLTMMSYEAWRQGKNFELSVYPLPSEKAYQGQTLPLVLPAQWQLKTEKPIHFRANGTCDGGIIKLYHPQQRFQITLIPPFCHLN